MNEKDKTVNDTIKALCDQNMELGKIIMQYRKLIGSLYETIHKPITMDLDVSKISQTYVMQIDKEDYERWQKAKSIIREAWNKN